MRRDARLLKDKAVTSLRRAAETFNSLDDDGRVTTVLRHAQPAFEMLLKAALVERPVSVADGPRLGRGPGARAMKWQQGSAVRPVAAPEELVRWR